MDNLELANFHSIAYNNDITGEPMVASVEDNVCCFITCSNRLIICEYLNNINTFELVNDLSDCVVQLKYLSAWHVVVIATRTNLLLFEPKNHKVTVLQSFATEMVYISWNPNDTFLIILDKKNKMYGFAFHVNLASSEYRLTEVSCGDLDASVPSSMYVGWGAQDTQFQGAKKTVEEEIEEIAQDYSPPVISWRGNGEQFVVNFWKDGRRFLRVFDRDLKPQFESKVYPNLLQLTSFKGQGNFIACSAFHNRHNKIVVFEKNCQVKSEFFVPENVGSVKSLQYHPDLNMLAVFSEDLTYNGYLNIYLNYNAHWYLKQQLVYSPPKRLISFHWIAFVDKITCTLNVLTSEAFERITFRIVINTYPENSLVAVIDGSAVHFTRFSEEIVPPPMSSFTLDFERPIARIFNDPARSLYQFVTCDDEAHYLIYDNDEFMVHESDGLPNLALDAGNNLPDIIYRLARTINGTRYEFFLDRNMNLLLNYSVVCNNVWSIYIHENYLIFTHASCRLYCVRLTPKNLQISAWDLSAYYWREVEQGAKIVCVSKKAEVIVELPRGNIEAVTCRVMAIDTVEQLLDRNEWQEAIESIRDQRLTFNLLIDLNPSRFLDHLLEFIDAAETAAELNNIISDFTPDNCFDTMYIQCREDKELCPKTSKTNVLIKVLEEVSRINSVANLNSIVSLQTKYLSLLLALRSICTVYDLGELHACRAAVSQILLYCHSKDVINEAYKIYHVGFMTFIYTCCSEDPRAFIPELEELLVLDPIERRYRMNVHAKNYKGATRYLMRIPQLQEQYISEFVERHGTQEVAYKNTSEDNRAFKPISRLYATFLSQKGRYEEAGFVLLRADMPKDALEEYKKALNWQQVVGLLVTTEAAENVKKRVLLGLANDLVNHKRLDEAVILYEHHCGAYQTAIEVLTDKKMFQKALSLARKYRATDTIDDVIMPAVIQHRVNLEDKIAEMENRFSEFSERLQGVRYKRFLSIKARHMHGDGDFDVDDLNSEYGSIISSGISSAGSGSSRGSTMSSRNRRKQERKKIDLREGGVYEDIALIRQLYLLIINIFECGQEVRDMCLTLTSNGSFSASFDLHKKLSDLQITVKANIPVIWPDIFLYGELSYEPGALAILQNRAELDDEFKRPPPPDKLTDDWKLSLYCPDM